MPATTVLAMLVLSGVALYFMTPEGRVRLARRVIAAVRHAIGVATQTSRSVEPFDELLCARTRWPVVTPLLIAVNAAVFTLMLFGRGGFGETQTLIDWGGNFAPRTTNGEWWRLIAAMFVHGGVLHFAATMAGLVPLGFILERIVGRIAFATTYFAAGLIAGVVSLWTVSATSVTIGASGAIFGIYGLLLASVGWALTSPPAVRVPLITAKRIAGAAVPFLLYNLVTDSLGTASELAGLGTGVIVGLVIARRVSHEKPARRRVATVMAAAVLIAVAAALPWRGLIDVRPEIARLVAIEERTAAVYDAAVVKFTGGRLPARALAQVIDRTILPELQANRARLQALRGVPPEQVPLVAAANEYLRLRDQSWRRRSEALIQSNMKMLRDADQAERAALEAFQRMRPDSM
jgi:membrane associated rhomboid family serine protease